MNLNRLPSDFLQSLDIFRDVRIEDITDDVFLPSYVLDEESLRRCKVRVSMVYDIVQHCCHNRQIIMNEVNLPTYNPSQVSYRFEINSEMLSSNISELCRIKNMLTFPAAMESLISFLWSTFNYIEQLNENYRSDEITSCMMDITIQE